MGETTMKNRIKGLRLKAGLTQEQLAKETGISSQSISKYEACERKPKFEQWQKLSNFFDVPISYLQGTTSFLKKYQLWVCGRCKKHFWVTEEPKYCPYCRSTVHLGYGTSKFITL